MDYLVDNYKIENISFTKPKKQGDYLICKTKYSFPASNSSLSNYEELLIQLPKMKIVSEINEDTKKIELEFLKSSKYTDNVYNFLSKLDEHILDYIHNHSETWFNKKIPQDKLVNMFNKSIKSPKSSNNKCTMNFTFKKSNCTLVDNKKQDLELNDFKNNLNVECIAKLKYIIFSKDMCYTSWELVVMKLNRRINRVPKFGFIEEENENNEDDFEVEDEIDCSFF